MSSWRPELAKRSTGHTIYLLDEPTTGLHFANVGRLDRAVTARRPGQLRSSSSTTSTPSRPADWSIGLGTRGRSGGGRIVAEDTPEHLATVDASHTGRYLRELLHAGT